ncbi:copper resistance CopC family protein [Actinomadura rugatobispora]|uniref:Copper resistance protein CopC n=1 Tax=Actinomadura rugatobispora TaxID=1994 RepID=A0ABW0ZVL1_9ACTN|nr:hypothetical protein GCM10010200_040570 [Actinomadura rugatobispora]
MPLPVPRRPPASRSARRLLPLCAAASLIAFTATPVRAHAELRSSDPAEGAVLATLPGTMTLTFTEPPSAETSLVTLGATRLALSKPAGRDDTLVADLGKVPDTVRGPVVVAWRAVSAADGHVASGVVHLTVRGASGAGAASPPPSARPAAVPAAREESGASGFWYLALLAVFAAAVAAGIGYAIRRPRGEDR